MATVRTIRRAFPVQEPTEQVAAAGLLDTAKIKQPKARQVREVMVEEVRDTSPGKKAVCPSVQRQGRIYAMNETQAIRRRLVAKLDQRQAQSDATVSQGAF